MYLHSAPVPINLHMYFVLPYITFCPIYIQTLLTCPLPPPQCTHTEFSFSLKNLLNASAPLPFVISHDYLSGESTISVSGPLDFETTDRYIFRVSATLVSSVTSSLPTIMFGSQDLFQLMKVHRPSFKFCYFQKLRNRVHCIAHNGILRNDAPFSPSLALSLPPFLPPR